MTLPTPQDPAWADVPADIRSWIRKRWKSAERSGGAWSLTIAQAHKIATSDCFRCGAPPTGHARAGRVFHASGLHRIDIKLGFTPGNTIPSCRPCGRGRTLSRIPLTEEELRLPPGIARLIRNYEKAAHDRGHAWNLSLSQALDLFVGNCHYCGVWRSQKYVTPKVSAMATGIDRVDTDKGYEIGNVVSCCKQCNYAKAGQGVEEFIAWGRRLVAHQGG